MKVLEQMKLNATDIQAWISLIKENEEWLMECILGYADSYGYTKYTSTLKEAWRLSIAGLSDSMEQFCSGINEIPEMSPDKNFKNDPASQFGMAEAQKHRQRGVNLSMYLGLMKYYRQAYKDLLEKHAQKLEDKATIGLLIERCFDHIEIAYCSEWAGLDSETQIHELSKANLEMTNEKNKYLTIFDSVALPIVLFDTDGYVQNMNTKAAEIFRGRKTPGATYYDPEKTQKKLDCLDRDLQEFIQGKEQKTSFQKTLKCHEEEFTFSINIERMNDVSNKFSGYVMILNDLTTMLNLEKEKQRNDHIMRQQSKMAEMGEMIGAIAHQWRQPLNAVALYVQNIEDRILDGDYSEDKLQKSVESIMSSLNYMSKTIDDFRNFFKPDKRKETFSVRNAIERVVELIEAQLKNHTITVVISEEDFELNGYRNEFKQAILNLIGNAKDAIIERQRKQMFEGKIDIAIQDKTIRISDNGTGISDKLLEKVGEPYFTTKEHGTGIGLFMARSIIEENMHGKLSIQNNANEGAEVKIFFQGHKDD